MKCLQCGTPIHKRYQSKRPFCSRECRSDSKKIPCKRCGTIFLPKTSVVVYCSSACAYDDRRIHELKERQCEFCGKSINRNGYRAERSLHTFCNQKCQGKWTAQNNPKRTAPCKTCGKVFTRDNNASRKYASYCSPKCYPHYLPADPWERLCVQAARKKWKVKKPVDPWKRKCESAVNSNDRRMRIREAQAAHRKPKPTPKPKKPLTWDDVIRKALNKVNKPERIVDKWKKKATSAAHNANNRACIKVKEYDPMRDKIKANDIYDKFVDQDFRDALTGLPLDPNDAQLDHKIPLTRGGTNTLDNVQWLSTEMNDLKGTRTNEEFIQLCRTVVNKADYLFGCAS